MLMILEQVAKYKYFDGETKHLWNRYFIFDMLSTIIPRKAAAITTKLLLFENTFHASILCLPFVTIHYLKIMLASHAYKEVKMRKEEEEEEDRKKIRICYFYSYSVR